MADRGPHSKECATAESGTCHCDCHGTMHGVAHLKLPKGIKPNLRIAKAPSGGGFHVSDPDTGLPPGGGTREERVAARVADVKVTATNGPTSTSTANAVSSPNADAISAKEAEIARAREALATDPLANVGGNLRTKRHGQQVDASVRRTAAAADKVRRLERELAELRGEKPQPVDVTPPAPRGTPVKPAALKPGELVSATPGGKPLAVTRVDRLDSGAAMVYHEKDPSDPSDMGFWLIGPSGDVYRHERTAGAPGSASAQRLADLAREQARAAGFPTKPSPAERKAAAAIVAAARGNAERKLAGPGVPTAVNDRPGYSPPRLDTYAQRRDAVKAYGKLSRDEFDALPADRRERILADLRTVLERKDTRTYRGSMGITIRGSEAEHASTARVLAVRFTRPVADPLDNSNEGRAARLRNLGANTSSMNDILWKATKSDMEEIARLNGWIGGTSSSWKADKWRQYLIDRARNG